MNEPLKEKLMVGCLITAAVLCCTRLGILSRHTYAQTYRNEVKNVVLINPYIRPVLELKLAPDLTLIVKFPFGYKYASGTGVILSDSRYVLTAAHVVKGTSLVRISNEQGQVAKAYVVGKSVEKDIALLRFIGPGFNVKGAELGNEPDITDDAWYIGNPMSLRFIVTRGIVSKFHENWLLSDTVVNPGASGGPLYNGKGKLIGICSGLITVVPINSYAGHSVFVRTSVIRNFLESWNVL